MRARTHVNYLLVFSTQEISDRKFAVRVRPPLSKQPSKRLKRIIRNSPSLQTAFDRAG